ncbi:MAG: transcriptional regulator NrdR [Oscillospiraceae bacterium]|nr:transcriptional regulator NrdR [Oscillospiraceae bacterium]
MKCPACSQPDSKVIDSRHTENSSIRRRRECVTCNRRFTTYEIIEVMPVMVKKKDGSVQEFDPAKIRTGLIKSCYKRPVDTQVIEKLISEVETDLLNSMNSEVLSEEIGQLVMEKLRKVDEISYVRFASVYREFKDVETLMREIQGIMVKK